MTNILAWYMIWMQPRIEGTCFSQASYFGRKCHSKSQSFMQNVCTAQRQPSYSTMTMVESPVRMANTPRGPGTIRTIHHGLAFKHLQDWKYRAAWPILDRKKNSWWVHVPIHSILVISSTHPTFQRMNIHQTTIANPERNRPAACFEIPPSNKCSGLDEQRKQAWSAYQVLGSLLVNLLTNINIPWRIHGAGILMLTLIGGILMGSMEHHI